MIKIWSARIEFSHQNIYTCTCSWTRFLYFHNIVFKAPIWCSFLQASKHTRVFASRTSFPEGPTIVWRAALGGSGSVNLNSYPLAQTQTLALQRSTYVVEYNSNCMNELLFENTMIQLVRKKRVNKHTNCKNELLFEFN
jgi:hypothetical protein